MGTNTYGPPLFRTILRMIWVSLYLNPLQMFPRSRVIISAGTPGHVLQAALCVSEINAKGVIMKAFEQYRLKTCIDYKPWSGEKNYISVFKGNG